MPEPFYSCRAKVLDEFYGFDSDNDWRKTTPFYTCSSRKVILISWFVFWKLMTMTANAQGKKEMLLEFKSMIW